jgi:hypothetical protein
MEKPEIVRSPKDDPAADQRPDDHPAGRVRLQASVSAAVRHLALTGVALSAAAAGLGMDSAPGSTCC